MAQKSRQNKLFAAEDFTVIYESYVNANFQAFDFDTIRTAMVDYVRNNYPENYNDWIESAEFVSLLDVVAQFGHNLAYRVDMNARNNFLSTAQKQESIYKLAEFLGYQPRRNVPAYGELKVVSVKTNENIIGSDGTSLGGRDIKYEISNNINNLDDFITVLNSVLQNSNRYGSPKKSVVINNIKTDFYDLNNTPNQIKFDAQGSVLGSSAPFNIISSNYDNDTRNFTEKYPDPVGSFGIYYKDDGKGITSVNTGFFLGIKQGSLQFQDFNIDTPIDSMSLDVNVKNINNSDIWVQNVNSTGNVVKQWTKVKDVNSNVIYNNLTTGERDIFSVKTRKDNQISVLFPDSTFGNVPKDTIRIWYRTSVNNTYILRPDDFQSKKIQINYTGTDGNIYVASFLVQLKQSISTASSNESLDEIRENAPKNYASQDRMITASDYNTMLGNTNGGILKIKSVNRTFSGHSRYSKFIDPTGTYSNLYLTGNDASLQSTNDIQQMSAASTENANQIFEKYLKNILDNDEFVNLYYTRYRKHFVALAVAADHFDGVVNSGSGFSTNTTETVQSASTYTWNTDSTTASNILNGYFTDSTNTRKRVGTTVSDYTQYITPGALIKFKHVTTDDTPVTTYKWAKVISVAGHGLGIEGTGSNAGQPTGKKADGTGAIVLDTNIKASSTIEIIYPALSKKFSVREQELITDMLEAKRSFNLKYIPENKSWRVDFQSEDINYANSTPANYPPDFNTKDASWVIWVEYTDTNYDIYLRTLGFKFASNTVHLGNIKNELEIGTYTKKAKRDIITMLGADGTNITTTGTFYVYGYNNYIDSDDYRLTLIDTNADSRPDNPDTFRDVVGAGNTELPNPANFQWEHIATDNQAVDPSFTNIIDVFALSKSYDTEYKNYLNDITLSEPIPPSSYQLGTQFSSVQDKKAISDTIVYKPVKYKPLFGTHAEPQLRARFRIIKLFGSNITDSDLKTKTVSAINSFFDSSNWDFGETFYFTELAAYVHKELAGILSSFVIVPQGAGSVFGDMFEYTPNTDELIIPDVNVDDIDIIENITDANIKAGS
jgi:hypothetical protein